MLWRKQVALETNSKHESPIKLLSKNMLPLCGSWGDYLLKVSFGARRRAIERSLAIRRSLGLGENGN